MVHKTAFEIFQFVAVSLAFENVNEFSEVVLHLCLEVVQVTLHDGHEVSQALNLVVVVFAGDRRTSLSFVDEGEQLNDFLLGNSYTVK